MSGFLRQGWHLQMACVVMMTLTRGSCSNNAGAEASSFNPVNTIQIFTASHDELSSNTTDEILRTVKRLSAQLEDIEEAVTNLQSQQADMAQVLATIVTRLDPSPTRSTAQTAQTPPRDCHEILLSGTTESGVFDIQPHQEPFSVYCDMTTDGGGWTVFQRRMDGTVNFYRNRTEYVNGFGEPSGEFWLGNEHIHQLTMLKDSELRIDLEAFDGDQAFAKYSNFVISDASDKYRLFIAQYQGTAGDSLIEQRDQQFSTYDEDNDASTENCAVQYHNAWWNNRCFRGSLNGIYRTNGVASPRADGIVWLDWKGYDVSLKRVSMKMRPMEP